MAEAVIIKKDTKRLKGAKTQARKMAKEAQIRSKAMNSVAVGIVKSNTKLPGVKKRK